MNTEIQRMADLMTDLEGILADGGAVNMLGLNVLLQLTTTLALNLGCQRHELLRVIDEFYSAAAEARAVASGDVLIH